MNSSSLIGFPDTGYVGSATIRQQQSTEYQQIAHSRHLPKAVQHTKEMVNGLTLTQLLLASLLLCGAPALAQMKVVQAGRSQAHIVLKPDAAVQTQKAAAELQTWIKTISGGVLDTAHAPNGQTEPVVYLGKDWLPAEQRRRLEANPMDDAFLIHSDQQHLWLAGKKPIGDLYAVTSLLEDVLGCIRFTVDETYAPRQSNIDIPVLDSLYAPVFGWRVPAFVGRWDADFCAWHKVSTFDDWGRYWVHSFQHLLSPEQYFEEHPEYFALVRGRRLRDGQLCLSSRGMRDTLRENLRKEIALNPSATYWSVSQNDCYNFCECEPCKRMYQDYGSVSGAYIDLANEMARAFPDKQISTLAYQFTRDAPTGIKPLPNVNIMFCSIECNRSMPLESDPRSADFVRDLKNWAALSQNIFVWDYVVQFRNYLTPFPNFEVLQPNIQLFRANGGTMMFQQGSGHNWSDLSDLKQYLIAKLLWNPDLSVDSVVQHYLDKYYGAAAPLIRSYYDLSHAAIRGHRQSERLDIYGFPIHYAESFLTPELLSQYEQLMDRAEAAVQNDSILLKRVHRARLPVDFAILDISLDKPMSLWQWVVQGQANQQMLQRLNLFVTRCAETGITAINERALRPEAYRAYILDRIGRWTAPNKLDNAKVEILTAYSPKYPVGGVPALNDRKFGGLSYYFNWMGFEGEDMVIQAQFDTATTVSSVSLNFMQAVESWIFLPKYLQVEIADQAGNFKTVAKLDIDNTDRNYLDRSFPFQLTFPQASTKKVRITAQSMKTCPVWHRGFGKPSWIFVDEVIVD